MPIAGLSGRVRTPRSLKARLGYLKAGSSDKGYPSDTDVFVAKKADGWSDEALRAYGATAISGAKGQGEEKPHSVGKALRLMLPWEFDATHDGREIAVELLNRAWAATKLRCSGSGGSEDEPGEAITRSGDWAKKIAAAAGGGFEPAGEGRWRVRCVGSDCPFWHTNEGSEASCHRELRLQALLLHPATDPTDPHYMKQLGWIEVASGSWNGAVDVQSGLAMIRSLVGRSAWIPFTLRRIPRTVMPEGRRVVKATLMVDYDTDEVLRFGYGKPERALLRPAVRRELLELAAAEAQFDSMREILPRQLEAPRAALPAPEVPAEETAEEPITADRDQAVEEALAEATPEEIAEPAEEVLDTPIDKTSRDELKELCGATPGEPQTMQPFRDWVSRAYDEFDTWSAIKERFPQLVLDHERPPFDFLTVRHYRWLKEQLREQPARVDVDPDEGAA